MIIDINEKPQLKYYNLMAMLYLTALLSAVVVVYKIIGMRSFIFSEGTVIFPFTYLFGDVIAEVYGYKLSRQLIWYSLLCELIFTLVVTLIIKIPSPGFWGHQADYNYVLGRLLHVSTANILAVPAGAFVNAYVITKWKIVTKGKYFWLRSLGSSAIGELVFCVIASPVVFYNVLSASQVLHVTLSTYVIKVFFAVISVFPATILVNILKKAEGIDIYDYHTNFNPFKLSTSDR